MGQILEKEKEEDEDDDPTVPVEGDMNEIDNRLWLGSITAAENRKLLKYRKITHVLTIMDFELSSKLPSVQYQFVLVKDNPTTILGHHFTKSIEFIDSAIESGGIVLIHCLAGSSRSATIVSAYLMWKRKLKPQEAIDFVTSKRLINPNCGFRHQLELFCHHNFSLQIDWKTEMQSARQSLQKGEKVLYWKKDSQSWEPCLFLESDGLFLSVQPLDTEESKPLDMMVGMVRRPLN